jgi:hypothetical protein
VQLERLDLPEAWFAPLAPSHAAGGMLSQEAAPALGLRAGIVLENRRREHPKRCARQRSRRARAGHYPRRGSAKRYGAGRVLGARYRSVWSR